MNFLNKFVSKVSEISKKLTPNNNKLTPITNQLYHCNYPTDPEGLCEIIRANVRLHQVQIWNLSEYCYPEETVRVL